MTFTDSAPASYGPSCGLAPCYRRTENVGIVPVVITELKLRHVQRQVLGGDLVERAHDAALDEGLEAVNRRSVNGTDHVFALAMPNALMRVAFQPHLAPRVVGGEQVDLGADGLADKAMQRGGIRMSHNAGDNLSFALYSAHDGQFSGWATNAGSLISVFVLVLPADIGFVNFNNTHQLAKLGIDQPGADAVAHIMSRPIGAETHDTLHLKSCNAFLAGQHHVDNAEPFAETDIGILKDGADKHGEAVAAARRALLALPMKRLISHWIDLLICAARAANAHRPTARLQIRPASMVVGKQRLKLRNAHLFGELWLGHRKQLLV